MKNMEKWVALGMTFGMMAGIAGCGSSKMLVQKVQRKLRKTGSSCANQNRNKTDDRTVYFRRNVKISY